MAQLVEHHLAKVRVAGSSPVFRSESLLRGSYELESRESSSDSCSAAIEDQTELIAIGISHRPPAKAVFVEVRIGPTSPASELDDA